MKGLWYETNFISQDEEKTLLNLLTQEEWCLDLKRRTQHYGYKYDYTKKKIDSSMKVKDSPSYMDYLLQRIRHHFNKMPDQIIVNEYQPGQRISPHVDCVPCFGPTVASLSLGARNQMIFSKAGKESRAIDLVPRSLVVLADEARYDWKHSITPQMVGVRISLTFRTVLL